MGPEKQTEPLTAYFAYCPHCTDKADLENRPKAQRARIASKSPLHWLTALDR